MTEIGVLEMDNKTGLKISKLFREFLLKFGANRVKSDMEMVTIPLCHLPDIIVKYFKANNDRYLELVKFEVEDGNK